EEDSTTVPSTMRALPEVASIAPTNGPGGTGLPGSPTGARRENGRLYSTYRQSSSAPVGSSNFEKTSKAASMSVCRQAGTRATMSENAVWSNAGNQRSKEGLPPMLFVLHR